MDDADDHSPATVRRMLRAAGVDATVDEVTRTERGFSAVYRAETDEGSLYLKAAPADGSGGIPSEARIQAVLRERTAIPVPSVRGVVDAHDALPAPFFVMEGCPGEELPYEHLAAFDDDAMGRLARDTGRHLGALHGIGIDGFGHVRHDGPELAGAAPSGDPGVLRADDSRPEWPPYFRVRAEAELHGTEDSRFASVADDLRAHLEAVADDLEGPFEPVVGRNDHGLHNLLVDPDSGAITAMLDWAYTLAVTPAFDFEFAVYLYGGSFLAGLPEARDRRPLVREAMLEGYRETAPERVAAVATPTPEYELVAMARLLRDFHNLDLPDAATQRCAERLRADVRARIE
jgi:aminoglycoside phosphotransferase (APT) family kinase protein